MVFDDTSEFINPIRFSGFLPNILKPEDLPIGTAVKVDGFGECGLILKTL